MLVHIAIKNLAIVRKVDLALGNGLTAITGETGAGKSIALDALGLCLGDRAESNMVREGSDKAEVITHFDLAKVPKAKQFLDDNELAQDDNPDECFIRRVISPEGRSKAFVNGIPVNLSQLKNLGAKLAFIHSQHAHYRFLKPEYQRQVLDQYGQLGPKLTTLSDTYRCYTQAQREMNELRTEQQRRIDRTQLLSYQVQELDEFSLAEHEFGELEQEFKRLSNTNDLIDSSQNALHYLKSDEDVSAISLLNKSIKALEEIAQYDESLGQIVESLQSALIQAEDASSELDHYQESIEADPKHLAEVEARYSQCLELARKHHVQPESLYAAHMELADELKQLQDQESSLSELQSSVDKLKSDYDTAALALSKARTKAAKSLSKEIQDSIQEMNLPHARVDVRVDYQATAKPSNVGNDEICIYLSVNPGQALDVMEKVISGGELSRIGLALQVISSKETRIPTMVFDEVDVGISGPTAALIGKLLRKLGEHSQVVCVTHLPQVAAQAHNQLFVSKVTDGKTTETNLLKLTKEERVNEIARLLAGDEMTETAIANAKDLLKLEI